MVDEKIIWINASTEIEVELTNVVDIRITRKKDAKSNAMDVVLTNIGGVGTEDGAVKYLAGDLLKVYLSREIIDTPTTNELIGVYTVLNHSVNPENNSITLKCADKTFTMLTQLYTTDITDTVDQIIEDIIQVTNSNGQVQDSITTNITTVKSNGLGLPSTQYTSLWKTAYDAVVELSQPEYTGDTFTYIFWFDENNVFNWTYPALTPEVSEFHYGFSPVINMKIRKIEADTINMVIYDAGLDKNEDGIIDFYLNTNASSVTNSMKYQPMTHISKVVRSRYTQAAYDALTNDEFVQACKNVAVAEARRIVAKVGTGLWESTITVKGAKYTPGALYKVSATNVGLPVTSLRLNTVVHKFNKNGWKTTLTLIEDLEEEL